MCDVVRVGIFRADRPIDVVKQKYGEYDEMHRNLLHLGINALAKEEGNELKLESETFDAMTMQNPKDIESFDGFVITGSKFSAFQKEDWILNLVGNQIRKIESAGVKLVGICFGHQLIAQAFGGKVESNPCGWEISNCVVDLNDVGRKLLNTDRSSVRIYQLHQDHVTVVPRCFEVYSSSRFCKVQGLTNFKTVLTFQGHPEFVGGVMEPILEARRSIIPAPVLNEGLARVHQPTDQHLFAKQIIKFLRPALRRVRP